MNELQTFATFGLPILAVGGSLLLLWASRRSAARIDAQEQQIEQKRASGAA